MNDKFIKAKKIDLYHYLSLQGFHPVRENDNIAYYLSPFREESSPSFHLNKNRNTWVDWGDESRGDVIDFVQRYQDCSKIDALDTVLGGGLGARSFEPKEVDLKKKNIEVLEVEDEVTNETLKEYMEMSRRIPMDIVNKYCVQAIFQFATSRYVKHIGVAIQNDVGGYTLRNTWFKGTTSPAGIITIGDAEDVSLFLFEGMLDFLSYITLSGEPENTCIILNSLVFIPMMMDRLVGCDEVYLYIDNDGPANQKVEEMAEAGVNMVDKRSLFSEHKDLNEYLQSTYEI